MKPSNEKILRLGYLLNEKLRALDLDSLELTPQGKDYFQFMLPKLDYVQELNVTILEELISQQTKNLEHLCILDHGGGIGLWSFLLKELGIGQVVYHDISQIYQSDVRKLEKSLGIKLDYFCLGDSNTLVEFCKFNNLVLDGMGSRNVIEHVPDLDILFRNLSKIGSKEFVGVFSTSANLHNPVVKWQHINIHKSYEVNGPNTHKSGKVLQKGYSGRALRTKIILDADSSLSAHDVHRIAIRTRGFTKIDIEKAVITFHKTGILPKSIDHPTNTRNPNSGSWVERLVHINTYKEITWKNGFSLVPISGFYNENLKNPIQRTFAKVFNRIIPISGRLKVHLSPFLMFRITRIK